MSLVLDALSGLQILILVFGGIVVYFAWKSYSRTKSQSMLLLSAGFAFVTIGAGLAGILVSFVGFDLHAGETVQAAFQAVGFLCIVYSLVGAKA